jgi:hypothetical protein
MTEARQLTIGPQGRRTRVLHVVYAFSIGGLENVIVQLINHLPSDEFEHCILSLTTVGELRSRIVLPGRAIYRAQQTARPRIFPLSPRFSRCCEPGGPT